ncbi:unnamed protein product, partial [Heterotrigona itama]
SSNSLINMCTYMKIRRFYVEKYKAFEDPKALGFKFTRMVFWSLMQISNDH